MLKGIDFSFGNGLTASQIAKDGYSFAGRYLSGVNPATGIPTNPKDITATELANYKAAGLSVIFFWETDGLMPGHAAGVSAAQYAQIQLNDLAAQTGDPTVAFAPVFFSADAQNAGDVTGYMTGTRSVVGLKRNAFYGSYYTCKAMFDGGLISYAMQTRAWSDGKWENRALLRQLGSVQAGPAACDYDEAAYWATALPVLTGKDKYGQWPLSAVQPPAPPPGPVRRVADGRTSLHHAAGQAHMTVEEVTALTVRHSLPANVAALAEYLSMGNWSLPVPVDIARAGANGRMPEGLVYYTTT